MDASPEQTLQDVFAILRRHGAFEPNIDISTAKWLEIFCAQAETTRRDAQKLAGDNSKLSTENHALRFQVQRQLTTLEDLVNFQLGLLLIKALDVFVSPEAALNWFLCPSSELEGRRPVNMLDTVAERDEVMAALCREPAR